jgi:hypothetical protein
MGRPWPTVRPGTADEYEEKERRPGDHGAGPSRPLLFMEVAQGDASAFTGDLRVRSARVGRHRVLRCTSPAVANAIAALLLHLRDRTGGVPDAYFQWGEGNPVAKVFEYLAFGEGDVAPLTREVLRRAVNDPEVRPRIHAGRRKEWTGARHRIWVPASRRSEPDDEATRENSDWPSTGVAHDAGPGRGRTTNPPHRT